MTGLTTVGVTSVFDEEGRFAPSFDFADQETIGADTVIIAIGQAVDIEALGAGGPAVSPRRTIEVDSEKMVTSLGDVWAAGDAAHGPRLLIDAVADGRKVAADIHRFFGGSDAPDVPGVMIPLREFHRLDDLYDRIPRHSIPSLATERRVGLREVELGFTEEQARAEAQRCLRCFNNIELDVGLCVLCGLCVDVCPFDLISIVPASDLDMDVAGSVLLLDETKCIRCALCIERCPTKALSMSTWAGAGVLPMPVRAKVEVEV